MPARPRTSETSPSCITPPCDSFADLGVVENRLVEHQAVFEGPPQQLGVGERRMPSLKATAPASTSEPISASSFPSRFLLTQATTKTLQCRARAAFCWTNSTRRRRVDRRLGVGHAGDRREAAGQRGGGAGLDRLVLLAARLAQLRVHVDQARRDDLARGVDHVLVRRAVARRARRSCRPRSADVVTRSSPWAGQMTRPPGDEQVESWIYALSGHPVRSHSSSATARPSAPPGRWSPVPESRCAGRRPRRA